MTERKNIDAVIILRGEDFESQDLKVNCGIAKVMVRGGIAQDALSIGEVYP